MYKVSELLGKPVISLSGDMLGTISNIYFDGKMAKATYIKLFSDEDESVYLPMSDLVSLENDAVVAESSELFMQNIDGRVNPINRQSFDRNGKSLGRISDIILDGVKIVSFIVGENSMPSNKLISAKDIAVFNDTDKPVKIRQTTKRRKRLDDHEIKWPVKTVYAPSYDFLIGKKLQRNIITVDGKIIAREGENVTGAMIEQAKKEGKLVVLALNSL